MMIKNYKISIKEEPQFAGETFEQTKERIMQVDQGVTQTYVVVSVATLLNIAWFLTLLLGLNAYL